MKANKACWLKKADFDKAYDGDTPTMMLDHGMRLFSTAEIRLYGVDTYEMNSKNPVEREFAKRARDYTQAVLSRAKNLYVYTIKNMNINTKTSE